MYPNAPVVLVTMELRHPPTEPLGDSETRELKRLLSDRLPIERPAQQVTFEIAGPAAPPITNVERFTRYLNRESTAAAAIREHSIVVETSAYRGWDDFLDLVSLALEARMQISRVAGVERIGLRYIDEIRVPDTTNSSIDWGHWIESPYLGPRPASSAGLELTEWQGAAVYRGDRMGQSLVVRYGPRDGFAVDPTSDLRRVRMADAGEFFLVDIDSFWVPEDAIPEYDAEATISLCHDLHRPVRTFFEGMITERLRNEVLRHDGQT